MRPLMASSIGSRNPIPHAPAESVLLFSLLHFFFAFVSAPWAFTIVNETKMEMHILRRLSTLSELLTWEWDLIVNEQIILRRIVSLTFKISGVLFKNL